MSSPACIPVGSTPQHSNPDSQGSTMGMNDSLGEDGVSVRPMRLKVLYTFDNQNKTNCLARWPHVLQIQTVAMDETTWIGVIELKTCIQAIVQCSPELVARLGQDYTVYAYDFSEYDNPLVGQGMLSWALAAASSTPDSPAQQSSKLITGRVCKNILGLFTNGVKETLEVKLRLVPVPTVLQSEYINAMDKYRELSKVVPPALDPNEWMAFLQSNPDIMQLAIKATPTSTPNTNQRSGSSMEVVNQLLSPRMQHQTLSNLFNPSITSENPGEISATESTKAEKPKKTSRPSSRTAVKRPRKPRQPKNAAPQGGNTSGYEEGTEGEDNNQSRKRAKITKADWNSKSTIGDTPDSLRVAASTAGSLRLFRPIAINPNSAVGSHLQEIPRAPTPVPFAPNQVLPRDRTLLQAGPRPEIQPTQIQAPREHVSPYPILDKPEDQPIFSIESANNSPERNNSPANTPPGIGSSPPIMRTRPPSTIRSSPPCPSSPVLPQMPRTDSGFMSGSLEDLFGEDNDDQMPSNNEPMGSMQDDQRQVPQLVPILPPVIDPGFVIEECTPGPMELLPTRMHVIPSPKPISKRAAQSRANSRAGSVMSEDGQQTLPPLRRGSVATPSQLSFSQAAIQPIFAPQQPPIKPRASSKGCTQSLAPQQSTNAQPIQQPAMSFSQPGPAPRSKPGPRMMIRTASMGSLTLPNAPASEPALPPSSLYRSQTWSEAPQSGSDAPPVSNFMVPPYVHHDPNSTESETSIKKKAAIKQKLEQAIANGEMPPYCNNCGSIQTPTWRKAWSQDHEGQPGYYEYSDLPGRVTCINILTRNVDDKPTSYQLIKKALLPTEEQKDFKEFLLCNPCGIWMSKYKSQRPQEKWEGYAPQKRRPMDSDQSNLRRRNNPRPSSRHNQQAFMNSEANFPQSDINYPQSEAYFPQSETNYRGTTGPPEGISPGDTTGTTQQPPEQYQAADERRRSTSSQPPKRLKAMTSDAASAALRRAIQSSPARWQGTRKSPIPIEEDGPDTTRRLLFPSPGKDGSAKVLGEVMTNVVQVATDFQPSKPNAVEVVDKENYPPAVEANDEDAEFLAFFEEEMARPSTPTQKSPVANPFKTPTRPNHRPITRSVSRSIRSGKSPSQLLLFGQTPTKTPNSRRRSPRNHDSLFESPFTATLNQLMSEANNHSPSRNIELEFGNMPDLPDLPDMSQNHSGINFNIEDFFSTDVPMPSSPPRMFHLDEDPMVMQNINWNEFSNLNIQNSKAGENGEVVIKTEPQDYPQKNDESSERQEQT